MIALELLQKFQAYCKILAMHNNGLCMHSGA